MKSHRLTSSLAARTLVAVLALCPSACNRKVPPAPAPSASNARPAPSALAATLGKDVCAQAPDRCACAAEHGAALLAACFPDRALQLVSRAPASCATPRLTGVRAEAPSALDHR